MLNGLLALLLLFPLKGLSTVLDIVDAAAYKKALEGFRPSQMFNDFNPQPPQSSLHPTEDEDRLESQGLDAIQRSAALREVYTNQGVRTKALEEKDSLEMQYAEKLLQSEGREGCYQPESLCHAVTSNQSCTIDFSSIQAFCGRQLRVRTKVQTHHFTRMIIGLGLQQPFMLTHCGSQTQSPQCTGENELHLSPQCHALTVFASWKGKPIEISHDQTCQNPLLTVHSKIKASTPVLDFVVEERILEESWEEERCEALQQEVAEGRCVFEKGDACVDANTTRWVDGYPVLRACWGSARWYQCAATAKDDCAPLRQKGCQQSAFTCEDSVSGLCLRAIATFACHRQVCEAVKSICLPKGGCMDGSCSLAEAEKSDDIHEGLGRLSALIGTAAAVSDQNEPTPSVFAGTPLVCEKYVLGMRNCCSDSGWADWIIDCPSNMQLLHRAIEEQRAVYLGDYRDGVLDVNHHYVYCLFPTKLARIVQQQGRLGQLGKSLGDATHPQCTGLSLEELQSIDYGRLNLQAIEKDALSQFNPPEVA